MSIVEEIVRKRRKRIERMGPEMGIPLPQKRVQPVTPFGKDPFIICEVKRSSPSRGVIAQNTDAVKQAAYYLDRGVKTISVLTEEEYFSGSLKDLYDIKKTFPHLCVLRKDFIIDERDIEVSHRAGADAVLLIASLHSTEKLAQLYSKAKRLGMEVLFEIHNEEDLRKGGQVKPNYTGFNSRDLATFTIDYARPLILKEKVGWETDSVFESGITSPEHADFALSSGFDGLLIGEAVMKAPALIDTIRSLYNKKVKTNFWPRLFARKKKGKPLVKICGITREWDAFFTTAHGADLLGFIFADSPRKADHELLKHLQELDALKVGVIVQETSDLHIDPNIKDLLEKGLLDAVQFHGDEDPADCYKMAFPYYKAVRIRNEGDIPAIGNFRCPRVLVDTFSPCARGGTGNSIPDNLIHAVRKNYPLWLAGGIGPDNVRTIIDTFRPELIDASSLLESSHGIKERNKIEKFFHEIERK